jgi:Ca-activated chloride channel homolog
MQPKSRIFYITRHICRVIFTPLLMLAFLCLVSPQPHPAQAAEHLSIGVIPTVGIHEVTEGTLLFRTTQPGRFIPAPTLKTDVNIEITGIIARTTVRQEFMNPSREKDDWAEGIYVFPLPETAAVDHLRMTVGERIIEGQIKERAEAKKVYEQAKQDGKRTSLVEQERPNIFTTSVANIGPGERITVEIEYQETIRHDSGQFHLRFPMVVGPRYISGTPVIVEEERPKGAGTSLDTDRVSDASRITPPVLKPGPLPINPVSLSLTLTAGFPVAKLESLSHPILVIEDPDGRSHVTLRKDAVPADRDFQLAWQPAPGTEPTASILTEQRDGETYALLMLMPPARQKEPMTKIPRDVTFIIDTSGSMAGQSIEQAKASLTLALARLTTQDRFNIIQFNNRIRSLFSDLQPVTAITIKKAVRYADHLSADGGTEMLPALRQALKGSEDPHRLQQVILLTDGQIGNEEELFELLHHRLGTRRVFTVGIGSAPNSHLMRKTAELGRGTFTYIGNTSEVKEKMDGLFRKLERPVLSDLRFDQTGWAGSEQYPSRIADLYEGEPLVLALRARSLPEQTVLHGQVGTNPWSLPVSMKQATARSGLSVHWARQKISALMDEAVAGGSEDSIRKAVLDVALAHHLVSKYTSLVAVDVTPARPTDKPLTDHVLATNLAHGQDYYAIFGLPRTATSGPIHLLLGIGLLVTIWMVWLVKSRFV